MDKKGITLAYLKGKEQGVYDALDLFLQEYDKLIKIAKIKTMNENELRNLFSKIELLNSLKETHKTLLNSSASKIEDFYENHDLYEMEDIERYIHGELKDLKL
jgi:hypothetical protein